MDAAEAKETKDTKGNIAFQAIVEEGRLQRLRTTALDEVCEDYLRLSAGGCADFPYHADLLDKKDLGLKTVKASELYPGRPGRVEVSNRQSFLDRRNRQVTPAKSVSSF
jgi:hypothetical protein